jgi:hypothetical protein
MLGAYAGDAMRNGRGGLFLAGWETACIHENSCDFILDHMGASDTMLVIDNSGDLEKTQRSLTRSLRPVRKCGRRRWSALQRVLSDINRSSSAPVPAEQHSTLRWHMGLACVAATTSMRERRILVRKPHCSRS